MNMCSIFWQHIDGLVQERRNSSALAMELHLSCTNPSISSIRYWQWCFKWKSIWTDKNIFIPSISWLLMQGVWASATMVLSYSSPEIFYPQHQMDQHGQFRCCDTETWKLPSCQLIYDDNVMSFQCLQNWQHIYLQSFSGKDHLMISFPPQMGHPCLITGNL